MNSPDFHFDPSILEYLKSSVGNQLANAFAEAICRRPDDAIEFIGKYLIEASAKIESNICDEEVAQDDLNIIGSGF